VAGYLSVKRGDAEAGISLLRDSLAALQAVRYELLTATFSCALAEGLAIIGRFDDALQTIDETIALVERNGALLHMPELLRIRGHILMTAPGADPAHAEDCFLKSLELAGQQSMLAWELRAGTRLAHLWSKQGRVDDARNLLEPICKRFSEGFGTVDFEAAQHLLSKLRPTK
jgi:predicted ATPase